VATCKNVRARQGSRVRNLLIGRAASSEVIWPGPPQYIDVIESIRRGCAVCNPFLGTLYHPDWRVYEAKHFQLSIPFLQTAFSTLFFACCSLIEL
jgi:hypothetical protein